MSTPFKSITQHAAEIRAANDNQALESVGRMRAARLASLASVEALTQDHAEAGSHEDDNRVDAAVENGVYDD